MKAAKLLQLREKVYSDYEPINGNAREELENFALKLKKLVEDENDLELLRIFNECYWSRYCH